VPKRVLILLAALLLLFVARTSRADSTICRVGRLAVTGQRLFEVQVNCGNPSWSQSYDAPRSPSWRGGGVTRVDEWVYDLGPYTFPRFLRFENGVLVRIEVLSR
jgi:hypothetical protein